MRTRFEGAIHHRNDISVSCTPPIARKTREPHKSHKPSAHPPKIHCAAHQRYTVADGNRDSWTGEFRAAKSFKETTNGDHGAVDPPMVVMEMMDQ